MTTNSNMHSAQPSHLPLAGLDDYARNEISLDCSNLPELTPFNKIFPTGVSMQSSPTTNY